MLIKTPSGDLVNLPKDFLSVAILTTHHRAGIEFSVYAKVQQISEKLLIIKNVDRETCQIVCDAIEIALLAGQEHLVLSPALIPSPDPKKAEEDFDDSDPYADQ